LAPITRGLDAQVHRTIDLSESGATRALATKLNDPQQLARCWRARVGSCTTGRERFLLRVNAGQHIPPICGGPACAFIGQGVRLPSGLRSREQQPYQQQHRGYVLQESHDVWTNQTRSS
jgi:hypothetical protein